MVDTSFMDTWIHAFYSADQEYLLQELQKINKYAMFLQGSGRNNNKMEDKKSTKGKELYYNLLPVQYTDLMLWEFLVC